jgi:hypothetical protein
MRRSPHSNLQDKNPHPAGLRPVTMQNLENGTAGKHAFSQPMRRSYSHPNQNNPRNRPIQKRASSFGSEHLAKPQNLDFKLYPRTFNDRGDPDEISFIDSQGIEKKLISIDKKIKNISESTIDKSEKTRLTTFYQSIQKEGIYYIDDKHCNTSNSQQFNPQDLPHILKAMTKVTEFNKKFISTFDKLNAKSKETKPLPAPVQPLPAKAPVQPLPALAQVKTTQPAQTKTVRFAENSQDRAQSSRGGQGAFNPSHTLPRPENTTYHFLQTQGNAFAMARSAESNSTFATTAPKSPPKLVSPIQSEKPHIPQALETPSQPAPPTSSNRSSTPTRAPQNQNEGGLWGAVSNFGSWFPSNQDKNLEPSKANLVNKQEGNLFTSILSWLPPTSLTSQSPTSSTQTPSPNPKPTNATEISKVSSKIDDADLLKSFSKKTDELIKEPSQAKDKYVFNQLTLALGKKPETNLIMFSWFSNPPTSEPSLLEKVLKKLPATTKDEIKEKDRIKETLSKFLDSSQSIEIPADELKKLQTKILEFRKSPSEPGKTTRLNADKKNSEYDEILFLLQLRINGKTHYLEGDLHNFKQKISKDGIDEALKVAKSTSNIVRFNENDSKNCLNPTPKPNDKSTASKELKNYLTSQQSTTNNNGRTETDTIPDFSKINKNTTKKDLKQMVSNWQRLFEEKEGKDCELAILCNSYIENIIDLKDKIQANNLHKLIELTKQLALKSDSLVNFTDIEKQQLNLHFAMASTYFCGRCGLDQEISHLDNNTDPKLAQQVNQNANMDRQQVFFEKLLNDRNKKLYEDIHVRSTNYHTYNQTYNTIIPKTLFGQFGQSYFCSIDNKDEKIFTPSPISGFTSHSSFLSKQQREQDKLDKLPMLARVDGYRYRDGGRG